MRALRRLAAVVVFGMSAAAAYGDGGAMLLHQDAGPFTISLFASPQPLQTGAVDLSVMVQDRSSGDVLLDPVIDLSLSRDQAGPVLQTVRMTRSHAGNRLLQTGSLNFSTPGKWRLALAIERGHDTARLGTECTIQPESSRARLVWFYILLPVGIILLFALHQGLKLSQEAR